MFSIIQGDDYPLVYYLLVLFLTIIIIGRYSNYNQSHLSVTHRRFSLVYLLLTVFFILFIGMRPINGVSFVDMPAYNAYYLKRMGDSFTFDWNTENRIFDNLILFLASLRVSAVSFFIIIAAIYFGGISLTCSLLFDKDKMASFIVYLGAFSTLAYSTNGIKAGAAAALFLVALAFNKNGKWLLAVLFLFLSWGFHHSMVLPVVAFFICKIIKNPRFYLVLWMVAFVLAAFHMTFIQHFFATFVDEQGATYLLGNEVHVRRDIMGGFRIDFILYSFAPLFIGWLAMLKNARLSKDYLFLLNLYTLTNSVWLLCMYAEFTNRIAYLSWFMFPIVLIYPLLKEKWGKQQFQTFTWVAFGHLAFTLILQLV